MQLLLTDRLTCPRCGPTFGLILRADRLAERRVHDGVLGCPNCRDQYRISGGFADLRPPPRGALAPGRAGPDPSASGGASEDDARVVALLGIVGGPGTVALVGVAARHARAVAEAGPELLVVALDADAEGWADAPGVSRAVTGAALPFYSGTLRGVVVDGGLGPAVVTDAARAVAPRARVVVTRATQEAAEALRASGLRVLASDAETIVAARG